MPLPTTNLTLHCDASDTDKVFTTFDSGGNHSGAPGDGDLVEVWDDEGDGIADVAVMYTAAGDQPTYRSASPLMQLPCLDFDGSTDRMRVYNQIGVTEKSVSALLAAGGKTLAWSIYVEGATLNNAAPYTNHVLFGDHAQFHAVSVRTDGGGSYYLQWYNWDGNQDYTEIEIDLNTSYVVIATHDGANLNVTLITDSLGTEQNATQVASGNTTDMTGLARFGFVETGGGTGYFNGRIGEFAIYNAALTGSDLTDLKQYFYQKWFPAVSVPPAMGGNCIEHPIRLRPNITVPGIAR